MMDIITGRAPPPARAESHHRSKSECRVLHLKERKNQKQVLTFRSMIATVMVMREIPCPVSATHGPHAQSEACAYGSHRSGRGHPNKETRARIFNGGCRWLGLPLHRQRHADVDLRGGSDRFRLE